MFQMTQSGASASTASHVYSAVPPVSKREPVRHLLFGSPKAVEITIKHLHRLGYAEPNDWSKPIPTGRSGEVMAILTKSVSISG
jgi:hypothetical protein